MISIKQSPTLFLILMGLFHFIFSQDSGETSVQGGIGAVTIDGKVWNQIAIRPVVPFWKLSIALDIVLYIDEDGNIRKDEWDFSSGNAIKNTIVDKIYYIRYGQPNDPLYIKVGALDNVTLGYGILVNGYSNAIQYPQVRKVGLDARVKKWGVAGQGFVNDFKENIGLSGLRVSKRLPGGFHAGAALVVDRNQFLGLKDRDGDGRPDLVDDFPDSDNYWLDSDEDGLADTDPSETDRDGDGLPDVDDLDVIHEWWDELGNAVGVDFSGESYYDSIPDNDIQLDNEPLNVKTDSDGIGGVSVDVSYPVLTEGSLKLDVYAQMAILIGKTINPATNTEVNTGVGIVPLGIASSFGPARLNVEYRIIPGKGRFEFGYWNRSYEIERATFHQFGSSVDVMTKESKLGEYGGQNGIYGRLGVDFGSLITFGSEYQYLRGEIWNGSEFAEQNNQSLFAALKLQKKISKISRAEMFYYQRNVPNLLEFEMNESTIMGYRVGIAVSSGLVLNYVFTRSFVDLNGDGIISGGDETVNITTIETSFSF